jgi:hypothetical protein
MRHFPVTSLPTPVLVRLILFLRKDKKKKNRKEERQKDVNKK